MRRQYLSNTAGDTIIRIDSLTRITKIAVVKTAIFTNYQYSTNTVNSMQMADIQKFYKNEVTKDVFLELVKKCIENTVHQFSPDAKLNLVINSQPN